MTIIEKELSYIIIGCAMDVHNTFGYGYLEKVYENALMIALCEKEISAQSQVPLKVKYHNVVVGDYIVDVLVENKVILELKASESLCDGHRAQLLNYLKATGVKLGILINFGKEKLEYERLVL